MEELSYKETVGRTDLHDPRVFADFDHNYVSLMC